MLYTCYKSVIQCYICDVKIFTPSVNNHTHSCRGSVCSGIAAVSRHDVRLSRALRWANVSGHYEAYTTRSRRRNIQNLHARYSWRSLHVAGDSHGLGACSASPSLHVDGPRGGHWNGHGIMRPRNCGHGIMRSCLHWDGYRFVRRMRTHKHVNYEQTCEINFLRNRTPPSSGRTWSSRDRHI